MRVMGIDPSLTSTGLALVVDGQIAATDCVKSSPTGDTPAEVVGRILAVADGVIEVALDYHPDIVVIESASFASKFGKPHERAGLYWFLVGNFIGMGVRVVTVAPQSRAKYGTGKGNAKKADVYAAVKATYQPLTTARISNNDIADAVLLASMGSRVLGFPVEPETPSEAHLASLTALTAQCK